MNMVEGIAIATYSGLSSTELLGMAIAYAMGCFATGYYLVRWRTGQDVRTLGSGNAGAKNAGRILGQWGFIVTLVGDLIKGFVAVTLAKAAHFQPLAVVLVMLAVVAGHNWPVQLGFQGGKGIAASMGAILGFDPWVTLGFVVAFLIIYAWYRKFTISGLLVYGLAPGITLVCHPELMAVIGMTLLAGMVLAAHHHNLREEWVQLKSAAKA